MWLTSENPRCFKKSLAQLIPAPGRLLTALAAFALLSHASVAVALPPVLTVPGPQTVTEGNLLAFNIQATDPEGQTIFLYALELPPGASFEDLQNNTGAFSWTPASDQAGSYVATFLADDTFGGMDQESVPINVNDLNLPPTLGSIGDKSVERGTMLNVSLTAFDPEDGPLTFSTLNLPPYGALTDFGNGSANLAFTPGPQTPLGTTTMSVVVSDGTFTDSETFRVTVTASSAQSPPVLSAIGDKTVAEGAALNVDISATDADGNTLQWGSTLPAFATLVPLTSGAGTATARLVLHPGYCDAGNYAANVSVNDGTYSDFEAFTITVANVNKTPVWNAPSAGFELALGSGASGSVPLDASDPDEACGGNAPALSLLGSSAGDALQVSVEDGGSGNGTLHVTSMGPAGTFTVTVRATDRSDAAKVADLAISVRVESTGPPPVAARAWADQDPLRLQIGKPRDRVYLEPIENSFTPSMVLLETIRLTAWEGAGSVESIEPVPGKFDLSTDQNRNGVGELKMEFYKDDLRLLLANVGNAGVASLVLHATLSDGRVVEVGLGWDVVPERKHAIQKIGPNPLNPEATIVVRAERDGALTVRIFDLRGRLVRTVENERQVTAGEHDVRFDGLDDSGRRLSSGRYFVRVDVAGVRDLSSITVVK